MSRNVSRAPRSHWAPRRRGVLVMFATEIEGKGAKMKTYAFELRHDGGHYFIRVQASSIKGAKSMVMKAEKCPARSIIWAHRVKEVTLMGAR